MAELVFDGVVRRNANSDTTGVHTDMGDVTITLNHATDGEGYKIEFAMVMWRPAGSPPDSLPIPYFVDPTTSLFATIKTVLEGETVAPEQAQAILQAAQALPQPEMQREPRPYSPPSVQAQIQGTVPG